MNSGSGSRMSNGARSGRGGGPRAASPACLTIGRILAALWLVCVPAGLYLISVAAEAGGIVLGVIGYFLGARRIGTVTVVLALLAMIFGLLTQGYPTGPGT